MENEPRVTRFVSPLGSHPAELTYLKLLAKSVGNSEH